MNSLLVNAHQVLRELQHIGDPSRAAHSGRFFKTGIGQYGEGDVFIGVTVPQLRQVAKRSLTLPLSEVKKLLTNSIHEVRLTALLTLVYQFKKADEVGQGEIYDFYLEHTHFVNNWDLVDSSAPYILGGYLADRDRTILYQLARSDNLWERRIAILATAWFIRAGESKDAFAISELLQEDDHDLIHKAVGWMLREVGKSCGQEVEEAFLKLHYKTMPRTMLRYAIERFDEPLRQQYLKNRV